MVTCASLHKRRCVIPCEWKKGKGCKSICPAGKILNPETSRCKKKPKIKKSIDQSSTVSKSVKKTSIIQCPYGLMPTPDNLSCTELHLIDSGASGCVISPPIIDSRYILHNQNQYVDRNNDDIGKIYKSSRGDYKEELHMLKFISKIDPKNTFTTKFKGAQHLSQNTFVDHANTDVQYCLRNSNNNYYQIILENGGSKLSASYTLSFKKFLKLFEVFSRGLVLLQKYNIVHRDMKPANVLIKRNKISLIDFVLSCPVDEVYVSKYRHILSYHYPWYPPEFYIADIFMRGFAIQSSADFILSIMQNDGYFSHSYMSSEYRQIYEVGITHFFETIKQKGYTKFSQIFTDDIAFKADVFAIAHILIALDKNIDYENEKQQLFVEYLRDRCIDCNPFTRISMKELHSIIKTKLREFGNI